jgi:hypothetical protein
MNKMVIQAELPPELTEAFVMEDVQWGLHGND